MSASQNIDNAELFTSCAENSTNIILNTVPVVAPVLATIPDSATDATATSDEVITSAYIDLDHITVDSSIQNEKNSRIQTCLDNLPDSGQDRVVRWQHAGLDGTEPFDFIGVLDGHGKVHAHEKNRAVREERAPKKHFIECFDDISLETKDKIYRAENPMLELISYFSTVAHNLYDHGTGAVVSFARIYSDRVETFNVGDARSLVFIDGKLVYINESHTAANMREQERLTREFDLNSLTSARVCIVPASTIELMSPTDIRSIKSTYTVFKHEDANGNYTETRLAPSQSLGHNNVTGYEISTSVIPYTPEQTVHVVTTTDGVMDMVCMPDGWTPDTLPTDLQFLATTDAQNIAKWARHRWSQEWTVHADGYTTGKQTFPKTRYGQDDIGIATWTKV